MSIDDQPLPSSDPGAPGALPDAQPGGGATTDASGSSDGANAPHAAGAAHGTKDAQEEPAHGNGADPRSRLVALRAEVGKAIVGQDAAITGLSSPSWPGATSCWRGCLESPRRSWCVPWPNAWM